MRIIGRCKFLDSPIYTGGKIVSVYSIFLPRVFSEAEGRCLCVTKFLTSELLCYVLMEMHPTIIDDPTL